MLSKSRLLATSKMLLMVVLLSVALAANAEGRNGVGEQAVIINFQYGLADLKPLFALEDKLESAINSAGAGVLDGDEVASDGRDGCIYMYGENADRLFEVIKPILASAAIMKGAKIVKRYGPPGETTRQVVIDLE